MADFTFTVGAEPDSASFDAVGAEAGAAIAGGIKTGSKEAARAADNLSRDIKASIERIKGQLANALKAGIDVRQFAPLQRGLERLLAVQREIEQSRDRLATDTKFKNAIKTETEAVQALTSSQTRELQSTIASLNIRARGENAAADRARAAQNIALQRDAQIQINAARTAGKARIVLAQQIGAQLLSAERIISNGVTNIIRGTAKTVGKVWDSTVGSLKRTFTERKTVVEGGLRNESRLFSQASIVSQRANTGILGAVGNNLGTIGGGLAIGAAARQIFTLGSDFTRGLNVMQAQLQLTADQMKTVSDLAIQLGNDINLPGVSALDAAQGIALLAKQFASLGPAAIGAAEKAAKGTLQLARAVGAAPEEAAATVGAAVNVFGEDAARATQVADQLTAALSQAAGTSFTDFSQAFTQGASVVSSFITPADGATNAITEFSAALAVLARGGLIGSDAGTSIKQFFLQANRGTDEVNTALAEVSARAGETGTAFFDASGKARPLVQTIDILQRGLQGLTEEQRAQTLQTIFGSDATRVANILIGQGAAELLKAEAATQRQGAAADLAAAQNKGLAGAVDAIKSQFETFAILIFQKVNPILGQVGLGIAGFIDKFANGEGAFATARKGILGVAAALGAIVAVKGISEVVGLLGSIVSVLGPFGLGIAAVGAVVGIATGGFRNFGDTLDRLKEIARTVATVIQKGLGLAMSFLRTQFERIRPFIQPVIERLETFGKRLIDIGRAAKQAFQFGGFSNALQNLRKNLGSLGQDILGVLSPLSKPLIDRLIPVRDLALNIKNRIVDGFQSINFSQIFSTIGRTISSVLSTSLGRNLTGAGIGAIAGGVIAGPLGAALGAAFGAAVAIAIPKLKAALGRINIADLFGAFLQKVNQLGKLIGQILSSRQFLLGVAGIAAAAAAIGVQFVTGFVSGVLSHLGDIASVGATILNTLFQQSSIVKAIAALVLIFRKQLFSAFTSSKVGQEAGQQLAQNVTEGAAKELPKGFLANAKVFGKSAVAAFADVGKQAARGLVVALSAGLSGSALGDASSGLEKGLAAGGLLASAGQAFAIGSATPAGPAGGAALAAATIGIGALTAVISANAKKSAEAKKNMQDYAVAIDQAGQSGQSTAEAISTVFSDKLKGASDDVIAALKDAGISFADLQDQAGKGDFSATIDSLREKAKGLREEAAQLQSQGLVPDANKASFEARKIENALSFINTQQKAINKEAGRRNLVDSFIGKDFSFSAVTTGIQGIITKINETVAAKKRLAADIAAQQLQTKLQIIKEGTEAIGKAADVSKQKILELAQGPQVKTPEQGGAEAVQGVADLAPDVSQAFLTGLDTALGSAQLTNAMSRIQPILSSAVQDGLGNAFTPEQIATNLASVKTAINQAVTPDGTPVSQEVKDALLKGVSDFEAVNVPQIIDVQAVADLRAASAAGDATADAMLASRGLSSGISVKSKADLAAAVTSGGDIINSADSIVQNLPTLIPSEANKQKAAAAGSVIHSTAQTAADKQITVGNKVTATPGAGESAGRTIATNVGRGFQGGFSGIFASVQRTVQTVLNGAVVNTANVLFRISSPSKVFMGIGEDVMKGLALGIQTGADEVTSATTDVVKAIIDGSETAAQRLALAGSTALGGIFQGVFNSAAAQARIAGIEAGRGLSTAFEGIRKSVEDEASALFQAASTAANERTPEQNRIIARSDFASVFNLSNQEAIQSAVEAVKTFGASLLAQGQSADSAAQAMIAYRGALLQTAAAAGLNVTQVAQLVDQLGLSNDALNQFVNLGRQATQVVNAAPGFAPTPPPPLTTGPNPTTIFNVDNRFDLPFGDPQAVSLAVVNRLAHLVR